VNQNFKYCERALLALDNYVQAVHGVAHKAAFKDGVLDASLVDQNQRILHGYAWIVSIQMALKALLQWATDTQANGKFTNVENHYLDIAYGEYLAQIVGGVAMGQNEIVRASDFGLEEKASELSADPSVNHFLKTGNTPEKRQILAEYCRQGRFAQEDLSDEVIDAARHQYRRYVDENVIPYAHEWHLENDLIPDQVVKDLADLGTFGICVPEEFESWLDFGRISEYSLGNCGRINSTGRY